MPDPRGELIGDGVWQGWLRYTDAEPDRFLSVVGPSYARADGADRAQVAIETRPLHLNRLEILHGGLIAAVADHAGFAALNVLGRPEQLDGVTIDLTVQFLGSASAGPPLVCDVEMLKETGRLIFIRMMMHQGGARVAAATATLRKAPSAS